MPAARAFSRSPCIALAVIAIMGVLCPSPRQARVASRRRISAVAEPLQHPGGDLLVDGVVLREEQVGAVAGLHLAQGVAGDEARVLGLLRFGRAHHGGDGVVELRLPYRLGQVCLYARQPGLVAVAALTYRGEEDHPGPGDGGVVAYAPG